jgi:hypothetical protein
MNHGLTHMCGTEKSGWAHGGGDDGVGFESRQRHPDDEMMNAKDSLTSWASNRAARQLGRARNNSPPKKAAARMTLFL